MKKIRLIPLVLLAATSAVSAAPAPAADLVAHEWGTFTSVQGADGVQLEWNPLVLWDLPKFVYDVNRVRNPETVLLAAKLGIQCRQRMETPVIYFYGERERSVDVSVNFPQGTVTEWYPQKLAADLTIRNAAQRTTRPALRWRDVQIVPAKSAAGKTAAAQLPQDSGGSHYFAARETDSAFVRTAAKGEKPEVEKFLFYRGTGTFEAPLTVTLEGSASEVVRIANTGSDALQSLFFCEIRAGRGRVISAGDLPANESRVVSRKEAEGFVPLEKLRASLGAQMRTALARAGLYEREAAAMVKTWDSAWFSEQGLRVLYVLPRAWTDRTLPLQVSPEPRETARVMVGRAELITPRMEESLAADVDRFMAAPEAERPAVVAATRELGLGRFMEATLRRILTTTKRSREFSTASWELLQAASETLPAAPATAAN